MNLYEILVPTQYGDTLKPIRTAHHKEWDKVVRAIAGGLTILTPVKGQWVCTQTKNLIEEKVIPVRIACNSTQIKKILNFTLKHYRQKAVLAYKLSSEVIYLEKK